MWKFDRKKPIGGKLGALAWKYLKVLLWTLWRVVKLLSFPVLSPQAYRHHPVQAPAVRPGEEPVDEMTLSWWQRNRKYAQRAGRAVGMRVLGAPIVVLVCIATVVLVSVRSGRTQITQFPDGLRLYYESVEFASADGTKLRGWFIPSLNAEQIVIEGDKALRSKRPGVVLCHGIGGNRSQLLPLAAHLNRRGYEVLLFDFRACGLSEGQTRSFGIYEVQDALAAVHYLSQLSTVDPGRIAMVGLDVGGVAALGAAAQDHSVRGVALINVDTDLRMAVQRKLGPEGILGQVCTAAYVWGFQSYFRATDGELSAVRLARALGPGQHLLTMTSLGNTLLQVSAQQIVGPSPAKAAAVIVPDRALTPFVNAEEMGPVLEVFLENAVGEGVAAAG